jgi:perosamine synthetase
MAYKYYLNEPLIGEKEIEYVTDVLKQGWLSAGGPYTRKFEEAFAKIIGQKHALAVQSGTAALHTALLAMGVGEGDSVVVPNYTCGSCATAVMQTNATPIIVDVDAQNFGMNVAVLEEVLQKKNVKAVMVVHVYGFPVKNFEKIVELCKKYKVFLLEDSSEAHGSMLHGRAIGSFGDMAVFSVRSEKMIGVGEGGLVLTSNAELYEKAKFYASRAAIHCKPTDPWWHKYLCDAVGMNYLLPHTLGAIGFAQVEKFPEILRRKRLIGEKYRALFAGVAGLHLQEIAEGSNPCYWLNAIILDTDENTVRKIGKELMSQGLEIRPAFWPLADMDVFKEFAYGPQDKAMSIFQRLIVLPSSVKLAENNGQAVEEIVEIVKKTLKKFDLGL